MCTEILKEISGPKFAWKVVKTKDEEHPGKAVSHLYHYTWYPDKTHRANITMIIKYPDQNQVFHCFATRKQARGFRKRWTYLGDKIIRLKLMGRVFEGTHEDMGIDLNGKPAICATQAYWDGKFHR